MGVEDRIEKLRNRFVVNMSQKTQKNRQEEERMTKEFLDRYNYERQGFPDHINKSKGQVDYINVSEISNGKDKYIVKDALYSIHYEGVASRWQYGAQIANKDIQMRDISVQHNDEIFHFTLKKENGTYYNEGDSDDKGNIDICSANFIDTYYPDVPKDIDLSNINSIRQFFDGNREIAYFLDKFLIVSKEEKEAYKKHSLTNKTTQKDKVKHASWTRPVEKFEKIKDETLKQKILGTTYYKTNY